MVETVGLGNTYEALLKKLRKIEKKSSKKSDVHLLLSLFRTQRDAAKLNIKKLKSDAGSREKLVDFTTKSIKNVKSFLKDKSRLLPAQMLEDDPLTPRFVVIFADFVSLLHKLGKSLELKKETEELAEAVYLAGCDDPILESSDSRKDKAFILAIEFRLFVDGLHESGKIDPWYWEFIRSHFSFPTIGFSYNPAWIFLAVFLFYAKDDKNLPDAVRGEINKFLEEKITGPFSEAQDFLELTEIPMMPITGEQDKCVDLLRLIYEAFEILGNIQTFWYLPDNVVGTNDYPCLNCETALACWMEIFAVVSISDKEKLINGIEDIISDGGKDYRKTAFLTALEGNFNSQGKHASKHSFAEFLKWSIPPYAESIELHREVVKELLSKHAKTPSSTGSVPEDTVIKSCSAKINNVATRLVDEVKKSFQAVLTDNGALDHPHHEFKFENVLSAEAFMKEDFESRLFESISGGAVQFFSRETSKRYDRLFEGKSKSIDEIRLELTHLGKDAYHFCTALGRREGFDKAVKDAIPSITEISDLDIFAPNKDFVERAILFNKGDIQATIWVNKKSTIVRRPDSGEILAYLKNRFPYSNGRFSLPSVYDKSVIVWVTEEDAVERWRPKLIAYRVVIGYAVTIDDKKCYFIEMPYKLK